MAIALDDNGYYDTKTRERIFRGDDGQYYVRPSYEGGVNTPYKSDSVAYTPSADQSGAYYQYINNAPGQTEGVELTPDFPGGKAGYTAYWMPSQKSGFDNKDDVRQWLATSGALKTDGTPIGTPGYDSWYYVPNSSMQGAPILNDSNPHQSEAWVGDLIRSGAIAALIGGTGYGLSTLGASGAGAAGAEMFGEGTAGALADWGAATGAAAPAAGYTGTLSELAADGLGGIANTGFGTGATAGTGVGMDWSTLTDFFGEGTDLGGSTVDWGASAASDYLQWPSNNIFDAGGGMSIPGVGEVSGVVNLGDAAGIGGMSYAPGGLESLAAGLTGLDSTGTISDLIKKYGSKAIDALTANGGDNALVKSLGAAGAGVAGYLGSKSQASDYMKLADRYDAYGAPSRSRYESSFAPGFTMANDPGYTDALNQSSKATLHGLSAQGQGNPADNPNAWAQSLKDNYQQTAYPALQNYRTLNANAGGIASAAPAAIGFQDKAIQSNLAGTQAIGSAANNIFNPPQTTAQQFAQLSQLLGK